MLLFSRLRVRDSVRPHVVNYPLGLKELSAFLALLNDSII